MAQGQGRSKKEARIAAAKAIKDGIDEASLPPPMPGKSASSGGGGGGGGAARSYQDIVMDKKRRGTQAQPETPPPAKKYDYKKHVQEQQRVMRGCTYVCTNNKTFPLLNFL